MTVKNKRVKTLHMEGVISAVAQTPSGGVVVQEHIWQDDVTIIGVELVASAEISQLSLVAPGFISASAEITRAATHGQDGMICKATTLARWTAVMALGTIINREEVMLPEGHGIDMDSGDHLNLIGSNQNNTDDVCSAYQNALIYYVER